MTTPSPAAHLRIRLPAASLVALLCLAGCGGGGEGSVAATGNSASGGTAAVTVTPPSTTTRVGSASLSWNRPAENEDGSYLADLAGYRVYAGTDPNSLVLRTTVSDPGTTSIEVGNLVAGTTHYFAVSAYTSGGQESSRSNVGSKLVN